MGLVCIFICNFPEVFDLMKSCIMTKKKSFVRVCSCTPKGDIQTMDARVLNQLVREQEAAIERERNPRKMARRAMELGDACLAAGCPMMAIQVWRNAAWRLMGRDERWVYEPINEDFMRFEDLVSAYEARMLGRRIDKAWHLIGHPEMANWERRMVRTYRSMWLNKYFDALP